MEIKTFGQLVASDTIWYTCGDELLYGTVLDKTKKTLTVLWEDGILSKNMDIEPVNELTKTSNVFTSHKEAFKSILDRRLISNILRRRHERNQENDFRKFKA